MATTVTTRRRWQERRPAPLSGAGMSRVQTAQFGREALVSHAAVDSEVLFWFVVALTVLLGMLISVVVRTPPGTVGSPQSAGRAGIALECTEMC